MASFVFKIEFCHTGWLVIDSTGGKLVILLEKRSRKYRIKIFRLRLYFRENRLWIFDRYACNACNILEGFINITSIETQSTIKSVITKRDKVHAYRAKIQSRFSRKQRLERKIFILYFRLLFSRRMTPFPLVPPVTNHPVYIYYMFNIFVIYVCHVIY